MSLFRRNAKRDASEPAVIKALEGCGASVVQHSGEDEPDLIVGWRGVDRWAEVKSGKAKLTPGQAEFARTWRGGPVGLLRDPTDAVSWLLTLAPHAVRLEEAKRRHQQATAELEDA